MPADTYPGDITIQRGEYWPIYVSIPPSEGEPPMDLTGYTARAVMRHVTGGEPVTLTTTLTPDPVTDDPNREIRVELFADESRTLATGRWLFSLEVDPPAGSDYTIQLLTANIVINPEIA